MRVMVGRTALELARGDITLEETDAIVNAANSSLMGGGGVDGAIHRAGGPRILEECKEIRARQGRLPTGEAVVTTGGDLKARFVIHTVGPVWSGGGKGEAEKLASCYWNCLGLAAERGLRSIAFPSVSTGAYRYPVERAAEIALGAVADFLREEQAPLETVRFVLFSESDLKAYSKACGRVV
jgi:O-acetyl-ADP-ribose deacetylase (regulator of RNase III)